MQQITSEEIKNALKNSGYFLESRVMDILAQRGFKNFPNQTYEDPITGKSRELDLLSKITNSGSELKLNTSLFFENHVSLIIECINNDQPVAFFKRPDKAPHSIYGKFTHLKSFTEVKEDSVTFEFDNYTVYSPEFHYNFKAKNTQYCSFSQKKGNSNSWMASHPDALHDTFGKLNDFINHNYSNTRDWFNARRALKKGAFTYFFMPVLILQNELIEVSETNGKIVIENKDHLIFEYGKKSEHTDTILIDVITENFLPEYIDVIKKSMENLNSFLSNFYSGKLIEESNL